MGGGGFLAFYGGSLRSAAADLIGDTAAERVTRAPRGQWSDREKRKETLERIGRRLRIRSIDDWALVTNAQLRAAGGGGLFRWFPSLPAALRATLDGVPEHRWAALERKRRIRYAGGDAWEREGAVKEYLDAVKETWGLRAPEDWTRVSLRALKQSLLRRMSLPAALALAYPAEDWESVRFDCTA
eukprot:CAMPEP_0114622488 /NCGR_PEP_ID=MMETSP0168-20121206/9765_1 /TAXON_ID=95228 ORGANISM="Vannella sp., Strain DIVA3 517/6/12" /NCGR_SAMPLE_ID=MMETSP0168 /ASSEMBLY_ACC=CAM_ASM_000044 /LENGTH=184 /DNA_ID=CAMNT_0001833709 /DNA_START=269 /DNA_END=819 /DNA_ORIENTATION=+